MENKDHREELAEWARSEFKKNKQEKDEVSWNYLKIRPNFLGGSADSNDGVDQSPEKIPGARSQTPPKKPIAFFEP